MAEQPNFLVVMSDEHGAPFSSTYGHPLVRTPAMDRLAELGVTFDNAYCNSPLCIPSRASFMTGQLVSRCEIWDNTKPIPVDRLTWPYLLRAQGYEVVLDGKMHLLGPDSLHGFERQLSFDPHLTEPLPHFRWHDGITTADAPWSGVREARPGRSPMIDADDAIEAAAHAYLREAAQIERPFALCVGFIAPHFPFVVPEPWFSMYWPERVDDPTLPAGHLDALPPAARRLRQMFGFDGWTPTEVRRARAAYFGLCSFLDAKLGRLLDTLETTGLAARTVVVHTSDHGDMLGEHGLWRKMSFYEQASRVPLQVAWPGRFEPGARVTEVVSLVDVVATLLDLGGAEPERWPLDGHSLTSALTGDRAGLPGEAICEHFAHGTDRALGMLRRGKWKLCYGHGEPPELELYDLERDPGEFDNLAEEPAHQEVRDTLLTALLARWHNDPEGLTERIVRDQDARAVVRAVAGEGAVF